MKSKKSQLGHGDFIVGFVIFTIGLLLFFKYSAYILPTQDTSNEDILTEGRLISESLLSQGFPSDWTTGNVVSIGLTDGTSKVDQTKLTEFINLDYQETRNLFKTRYDYYLYFTDNNDNLIKINETIDGLGYPGIDSSNINTIDTDRLTKITRLVRYDSEIVKMVLLLW